MRNGMSGGGNHHTRHDRRYKFFEEFLLKFKQAELKPTTLTTNAALVDATTIASTTVTDAEDCFTTNQVVFVIGVTCLLNFAFMAFVLGCVQFLQCATATANNKRDKRLKEDGQDCEDEKSEFEAWRGNSLRFASLPDNVITKNLAQIYFEKPSPSGEQDEESSWQSDYELDAEDCILLKGPSHRPRLRRSEATSMQHCGKKMPFQFSRTFRQI